MKHHSIQSKQSVLQFSIGDKDCLAKIQDIFNKPTRPISIELFSSGIHRQSSIKLFDQKIQQNIFKSRISNRIRQRSCQTQRRIQPKIDSYSKQNSIKSMHRFSDSRQFRNVLRNFGSLLKNYALRNCIDAELKRYIRNANLSNFEGYRKCWSNQSQIGQIFKKISHQFITNEAIPAIYNSKISRPQLIISKLHIFYQGILYPQSFCSLI